jgi:hypothetical protein
MRRMKRTLAIGATLFAVLLSGCQVPPRDQDGAANPASVKSAAVPVPTANLWERSRQCAERAEKVVKQIKVSGDSGVVTWENHYSPKYERCFVLVTYQDPKPDIATGTPALYVELADALENRLLAAAAVGWEAFKPMPFYCRIREGSGERIVNCSDADAFIQERMNK